MRKKLREIIFLKDTENCSIMYTAVRVHCTVEIITSFIFCFFFFFFSTLVYTHLSKFLVARIANDFPVFSIVLSLTQALLFLNFSYSVTVMYTIASITCKVVSNIM